MTQHRQNTWTRTSTKRSVREALEPGGQRPTMAGRGHHHGPWWFPRAAHGSSHSRGGRGCPDCIGISSWPFVFLRDFSVFAVVLRLKDECIWLHSGLSTLSFYHSSSITLLVFSLD